MVNRHRLRNSSMRWSLCDHNASTHSVAVSRTLSGKFLVYLEQVRRDGSPRYFNTHVATLSGDELPKRRCAVWINDRDVEHLMDPLPERGNDVAESAGLRHQQIAVLGLLICVFLGSEAGPFHEVQNARRTFLEELARALSRLLIVASQTGVAGECFAAIATHVGESEQPHRDPEEWNPDQLLFDEELERRDTSQKRILQDENVRPALMIRDHDVPAIARQGLDRVEY